jgi:hypothetical protein
MNIAHYIVRPKNNFWLLERKDTNAELALFDTSKKAVSRAEALARDTPPSLLEIHTGTVVEHYRYPFVTTNLKRTFSESYE